MSSAFNPLAIPVAPWWGSITTRQPSPNHHLFHTASYCRTVNCLTKNRTLSTLRMLQSSYFGFPFLVGGANRSSAREVRAPAKHFQVSRIRSAVGRRHHRRRDDEFASYTGTRSNEKPQAGPGNVQFRNNKWEGNDDNVVITLDMDDFKRRAAETVVAVQKAAERSVWVAQRAAERSVDKVARFAKATAQESSEAWRDLRTSVRVQKGKHVVISVRRSSLVFAGKALVGSILFFVCSKLLLDAMREYGWGWEEGFSRSNRVVRDRSLGGKEVILNKGVRLWEGRPVKKAVNVTRSSNGPLDFPVEDSRSEKELLKNARARGQIVPAPKKEPRLPGWWPESDMPPSTSITARQRAAEEALMLVQGIMQKRLSGYDFSVGDVLQLRQLCKAAGAKVNFDTHNTRDSLYRAAIDIVLSACQGADKWSTVQFGSEGGVRFIAGLSANLGLENDRAATMVNAAVAARTRAGLLQARVLYMQSKSTESQEELLKLIRLHSCFPPDPNSAEMEMVARGLGSHFDKEGRIEMLQLYQDLGGVETRRVAEEALGLLLTS